MHYYYLIIYYILLFGEQSQAVRYFEDVPEFRALSSISNADFDAYDARCVDVESPCRFDKLWDVSRQLYTTLDRVRLPASVSLPFGLPIWPSGSVLLLLPANFVTAGPRRRFSGRAV